MEQNSWKQVNLAYPGPDPRQRERQAVEHLTRVLPAAEAEGLITSWWFIRKGPWRIRYLPATPANDPVHLLLTDTVNWTTHIYEPETHAFGGAASMNAAHTLFHHDSRHLLDYLSDNRDDRREHALILCTALMRAAGLDINEQGDVWAKIAEQRAALVSPAPNQDLGAWTKVTAGVRHLLLGAPRAGGIASDWLSAFEDTGKTLRTLGESGTLTRGIRRITALHIIFHMNRLGIRASTQATLARTAQEAIFNDAKT
ncbi:thiopeptide-type bacteriocin biosynthesis protein [Micromonospora sp. NBC_00362]|uniref:thiopeptide-type bacteriocin biosynthesis protein n=1 Tax=Micromonospora sp. NBC_00362 TaxID=2975975 RepID=UPI00225AE5FE|nr:thiopeptide-type bacteriocin biosynthesis protein [Micromonospora sp. NBC_00362]MCX5122044.1 thiopeptide-type bacteriocin biosynthesis protein [Micromonospora sp. NBC_00362]